MTIHEVQEIDDSINESKHSRQSSAIAAKRNIPQVDLELKNVTYAPYTSSVKEGSGKTERKRRIILSNVSTKISPSTLNAWIGPSGSGKTSLISVAAGLTNPNDILEESTTFVNGEEGSIPKRLVGVVWQDDLLLSNLTIEETIYFSARLKSPLTITNDEIQQVVEEVLEDLGLLHIRNSLIGNYSRRGISGGERKRVSVASELVIRPSLLFLDEPTSGLDATSAQALIQTLKDLARMGHSIAVVIHQPRTTIYNQFDNLLLLSKGRMVYDGPACKARSYLEACPSVKPLPPETGIADWIMDTISADEIMPDCQLPKHWEKIATTTAETTTKLEAEKRQQQCSSSPRIRLSLADLKMIPKFETPVWIQFKMLLIRTLKQQRGDRLTVVTAILTLAYVFFTSILWWRIPDDTNRIFERNSVIFFMLIAQSNQVVVSSVQTFSLERALLYRERAKKMYRVSPFFVAKTIADMTNNVLLPCVYAIIVYWTTNLRPTAGAFFRFLLSFYMTISTAQSMGLFLSVAIPNTQIALILAPAITLFFMILGGFYIPFANIHDGIRWLTWLSFANYGYTSQIVNEFIDRDIPCFEDGDVAINFGSGSGDECPLPGNEVLASLGIDGLSTDYWFNISMLVVLQVFFRFAAYFLLRKLK